MLRYTALYKIEIYVEDNKTEMRCGVLTATDFTDVMRQLEKYYGRDIQAVHFIEMYDMDHFCASVEYFDALKAIIDEEAP